MSEPFRVLDWNFNGNRARTEDRSTKIDDISYHYDEAVAAGSDHALIVADFDLESV